MNDKDMSVIPKGFYCYNKSKLCPYWKLKNDLPYQHNGYCEYLGKSDMDLNKEYHERLKQDNKEIKLDDDFPLSLLWDQIKECGTKEPKPR